MRKSRKNEPEIGDSKHSEILKDKTTTTFKKVKKKYKKH